MNTENISMLAKQLQDLGFGDLGYSLAKRIAFKPENFVIQTTTEKNTDLVVFQIFIEKEKDGFGYILKYYEAALQSKKIGAPESVAGINISALEKRLSAIDWKLAFQLNEPKPWNENADVSKEQAVEAIINDLIQLESTEEGKAIASKLKLKYWNGTNYFELFNAIASPKGKGEISQRFYVVEGQTGISVDEALRFLQNRIMEKEMKRKQTDDSAQESGINGEAGNSGSGLLKKRRLNGTSKKGKHKTTVQ